MLLANAMATIYSDTSHQLHDHCEAKKQATLNNLVLGSDSLITCRGQF